MKYIVDISYWQGKISETQWKDIKAKTIGVILRFGYRGYGSGALQMDTRFNEYWEACKRHGIPVGLYFFTQALTPTEAVEEANMVMSKISPSELTFPVFCDTELANGGNGRADKLGRDARTKAVRAFCKQIQKHGAQTGVYASTSWLNNQLDMTLLPFDIWCADYRGSCGYSGSVAIWQYSSKNALGITGFGSKQDCNICYKDYSIKTEIKEPAITSTPCPSFGTLTLKKNSRGTAVKNWQTFLNKAGYNCGNVDGIFGNKTLKATKDFQSSQALVADGQVGRLTKNAAKKVWSTL